MMTNPNKSYSKHWNLHRSKGTIPLMSVQGLSSRQLLKLFKIPNPKLTDRFRNKIIARLQMRLCGYHKNTPEATQPSTHIT